MTPQGQRINDKLVAVYNDIVQLEEIEIKKSQFKDLSIKEIHTINAIGMYHRKTSSEVARALKVTPGTLSVSINNLVRKGYAERLRSDDDRSIIHLGLTRKGRLMYRLHQSFHRQMVQSFLKDLNEQEVTLVEKALDNLQHFLDEYS
ncbi:MarR family winged helix-turn-helix transcriptional regulator [Loigolactobacillus coryniformis]|uniref:MarR family winged helix-turn-helix transcriptional regulator n=1 Tax=Loigolactobacillus coryniformis TaxID=1610 RepID=UPI00234154F0|nr:MarR family winged helix-turn-helix transcriptional regulator [Loigolactobacillus coryniformis]MDC4184819.1 MarR family winged helix-turn-helix transcriptional regulator [Loigolactobacillus coryniformis]